MLARQPLLRASPKGSYLEMSRTHSKAGACSHWTWAHLLPVSHLLASFPLLPVLLSVVLLLLLATVPVVCSADKSGAGGVVALLASSSIG